MAYFSSVCTCILQVLFLLFSWIGGWNTGRLHNLISWLSYGPYCPSPITFFWRCSAASAESIRECFFRSRILINRWNSGETGGRHPHSILLSAIHRLPVYRTGCICSTVGLSCAGLFYWLRSGWWIGVRWNVHSNPAITRYGAKSKSCYGSLWRVGAPLRYCGCTL